MLPYAMKRAMRGLIKQIIHSGEPMALKLTRQRRGIPPGIKERHAGWMSMEANNNSEQEGRVKQGSVADADKNIQNTFQ